jgi:hypothetical protein
MATGVICPQPILTFWLSNGQPAVGGSVLTQVGGVNAATYQDIGLTTPLPNPIPLNSRGEISNAAGASCQLFLTPNTVYIFTMYDALGNQFDQATYVNGVQVVLSQANIGLALYPQTANEIADSIVPVNYQYPPGNILRYGTNTVPGTTDMSSALSNAIACNSRIYIPAGLYLIAQPISLLADITIYGDGVGSQLNLSNNSITTDWITGSGITNTSITDLQVNVTSTVGAGPAYSGAIGFRGSTYCRLERVTVGAFNNCGLLLEASSNCRIAACSVSGFYGSFTDGSDIKCYTLNDSNLSFNVIDANQCFGGTSANGIALETSSTPNTLMFKNVITNNRVGTHTTYGILLYCHQTPDDTYNQVIGNYVENITGSGLTGQGGPGIYIAGMTGVTIANNVVYNCCTAVTTQYLQAVLDMAQGNTSAIPIAGIAIFAAPPGTTITGNTVSSQISNGALTVGIWANGVSGLTISGNSVNIVNTLTSTRGIFVYATATINNITINGNSVIGCSYAGISLEQVSGSFLTNDVAISGNSITGGGSSSIPLRIVATGSAVVTVTGNVCNATTVVAMIVNTVAYVRCAGNTFSTTGTLAVQTSGACGGGMLEESNLLLAGANGGILVMDNGGTGFNVRNTVGTAAPSTVGTWALGDVAYNLAGAASGNFAWVCTTAGTAGAAAWTGVTIP